mmetsp:Transcript_25558/g.87791  ORF Transcript_25558/g.87791 Transcript_25558/m.87791 type:complete len:241 (-) Transcript_25558:58-780(-)
MVGVGGRRAWRRRGGPLCAGVSEEHGEVLGEGLALFGVDEGVRRVSLAALGLPHRDGAEHLLAVAVRRPGKVQVQPIRHGSFHGLVAGVAGLWPARRAPLLGEGTPQRLEGRLLAGRRAVRVSAEQRRELLREGGAPRRVDEGVRRHLLAALRLPERGHAQSALPLAARERGEVDVQPRPKSALHRVPTRLARLWPPARLPLGSQRVSKRLEACFFVDLGRPLEPRHTRAAHRAVQRPRE